MEKFNRSYKVGQFVQLVGDETNQIYKISEIHNTRKWIKLEGLLGSFQKGHIKRV